MSFLLRVASQACAAAPDIPVAQPKGLLPAALPAAPLAIEQALPPAPMRREPRSAPSPMPRTEPERARPRPMGTARPASPPPAATSPTTTSAQEDSGSKTPLVVEQRIPVAVAAEVSSPAGAVQVTPPDAGQPRSIPAAHAALPADPPAAQLPRRLGLEVVLPTGRAPGPGPSPAESPVSATQTPDDERATPREPVDRREVALGVESPQRSNSGLTPEPGRPATESRPIEQSHFRPVEVVPIAQPLIPSLPLPPTDRVPPARPAAEAKQPLLQIDQIDVLVTDPAPTTMPASARPFAAVAANRRYLRRL